MIMRIKFAKIVAFFIVLVNIIVVYYTLRLFVSFGEFKPYPAPTKPTTRSPSKHISKLVTVILRGFDTNENDVTATVQSFINVFPNIQIFVLYDTLPYPPLELYLSNTTAKNVKIFNLSPNLNIPFIEHYPVLHIKTKYVLFVPDSTRIPNRQILQQMVLELYKQPESIITVGFNKPDILNCLRTHIDIQKWTLKYDSVKSLTCDSVTGKHVTLLETDILKRLPNAFLLPMPQSLYLQTSALHIKIKIFKGVLFQDGKPLYYSHHAQWKQQQIIAEKQKHLFNTFQIKQVIRENGVSDWYGCKRETPSCVSITLGYMPSYIYDGKWTPPCCLANLRKTAKYVFDSLDETGIRYWLEGGSLLGAMRNGDILPWDYDVNIGINRDDIHRCMWLQKAKNRPIIDNKGFLWEKATEGNFFRVHYSKINRIHVNLFPFYVKNGTMTRDSWYINHKNMEFPDHFLHPMSSIEFIGRSVPSPNNIRDFLELKFGKGVIENPEYPNSKFKFP